MPFIIIGEDEIFTLQCAVENLRSPDKDDARIDAAWRIASKIEDMTKKTKIDLQPLNWVREDAALPKIAQWVLLAHPRQNGHFWDIVTAQILVRHESVYPKPVPLGGPLATEYWWETNRGGSVKSHPFLVTGNNWWASLDHINLPPGADHIIDRGYHYVAQPIPVFVGKDKR